jgi:hypothetical protein
MYDCSNGENSGNNCVGNLDSEIGVRSGDGIDRMGDGIGSKCSGDEYEHFIHPSKVYKNAMPGNDKPGIAKTEKENLTLMKDLYGMVWKAVIVIPFPSPRALNGLI